MGKLKRFEIIFLNNGVFRAGRTMAAKVILELEEPVKVEMARIVLKGKAKTSWRANNGRYTSNYGTVETYFNHQIKYEFVDRFPDKVIPVGLHEMDCSYELPLGLPSSYEGSYGHVRYVCSAELVRSWKFNIVSRKVFFVVSAEDLNMLPILKNPIDISDTRIISCLVMRRGTVSFKFELPKRGYVPGEHVEMTGSVTNNAHQTIKRFVLRLVQHVQYRSEANFVSCKTKVSKLDVARQNFPIRIATGQSSPLQFSLRVPSIPPRLQGCTLIDIKYQLEAHIGSLVRFSFPITIGTVPIRRRSTEATALTNGQLNGQGSNGDRPPSYASLLPPCYEECVTGVPAKKRQVIFFKDNSGDAGSDSELELTAPKYCYYGTV